MKRSKKASGRERRLFGTRTRERRPFGIWALTVFALVINGILPIYSIILLFSSPQNFFEVASILTVIYLVVVALGVIITSIGTWLGRNWARKALLVFITLAYAPQVITSLVFILLYKDPETSAAAANEQILQGVVTVAVFIWYFNRARVKRFYGIGIDDETAKEATNK